MIVYSNVSRKGSVERIEPEELVDAVFLMASRAKEAGCKTVFFPEVGALPLKYVFQRGVMQRGGYDMDVYSSKLTAISKSTLSKQICSILTAQERSQGLTDDQVAGLIEAIDALPQLSKQKLLKMLDINQLSKYQLSELINIIGEIGLYIPSEDKSNWIKDGVIPDSCDINSYSPEDNSFQEFQDFRQKMITYSIARMPDIVHDTRPLFNVILSGASFAKASQKGMIYVMDEAVSRGRTLNAIDIVFKVFNSQATWKIGVLFCPLDVKDHEKIDFIFSNKYTPPFSNRFDLIGEILVESDTAFTHHDIEKLLAQAQESTPECREEQVAEYFERARLFTRDILNNFLEDKLINEDDLVRLLHFIFVCNDEKAIKRSIDLNPTEIEGIIEVASFYINMPHPFDPMPMRKRYKNNILKALGHLKTINGNSSTGRVLNELKRDFLGIRRDYELLELKCWVDRYHDTLLQLDYALTHKSYI